jgi:glyoxylate reductase
MPVLLMSCSPARVLPRLLVTRTLLPDVEARIASEFRAKRPGHPGVLGADELVALAEDCDALFITSRDKFTPEVIARLPASVRAVATFSVGLDHIDLPAAKARGLAIINTPGVLTEATADLTMLLLLGAARHAGIGDAYVRTDAWTDPRENEMLGLNLGGRTLGIVGLGRIGQAFARRARAFRMSIHYTSPRRIAPEDEAGAVYHHTLEELLPHSQVLSLHCPSTPATAGMINTRTIELLPPQAVFLNAARGALVVDEDLIAALRSGRLFAAGLDVFKGEPRVHPGYRDLPNVFLMPHLGSATFETRSAMGHIALDSLLAFFAGEPTPARVV